MKTLFELIRKARVFYPSLSVLDILIAGLEELLVQNTKKRHFRTRNDPPDMPLCL